MKKPPKTTEIQYSVKCTKCGMLAGRCETVRKAMKLAKDIGWQVSDKEAYCNKHKNREI
jgi:hypothetical protein